jgi:hypothetical protein
MKMETCKDFVSHPHIVENKHYSMSGEYLGTRQGGCYQCQMACASDEQGVNQIAQELDKLNIPNDIHQTGGFTMCVYIKTGKKSYIYANQEGFGMYKSDEDYEGENVFFGDDFNEKTPQYKAELIVQTMKEKNLKAKEIK